PDVPGGRAAAPHARRDRQPRPLRCRRTVDSPRRPPALPLVAASGPPVRGTPPPRAHPASRGWLGAGSQRDRRHRRHPRGCDRREVIEAVCDQLPNGAPVTEVLALVHAFVSSPFVVALDHTRSDGTESVERWTTPEMLATEHRLLDLVGRSWSARVASVQSE